MKFYNRILQIFLPFVFLLMIGAVDFGRMWTVSTRLSDAAYAGAAYGAQTAETAKDTQGIREVALHELGLLSVERAALMLDAAATQTVAVTPDGFGAAKGENGGGGDIEGKAVSVDDYEILVDRYCRCEDDSSVDCDTGTCTAGSGSRRTYVQVRIGTNFTTIFDYPGIPPVIALEREARLRAR